ncbi:MAG: phosphohydrolase [Spirochaetales bacterium]|nr:phosphohydrolase [Spirochaetales bacterium]
MIEDRELARAVGDILENREFRRLGEISHHGNSVLDHSLEVCALAWRLAGRFRWDRVSAARGALLHDFFLYDWKIRRPENRRRFYEVWKMHGFTHPKTALDNASFHFILNERERDIIGRHMFPLTPVPPRTREGWLVNLCDKWVSLKEIPLYWNHLRGRKG